MLWVLDTIVDSYDNGLPIGYYSSQWFANWFLQDIDHYIKENLHVKCYVRYVDDMIFFDSNKRKLREIHKILTQCFNDIDLEMKDNWQIFRFNYNNKYRFLDFMGYKFYRNKVTIRKTTWLRVCRKARKLSKKSHINWYSSCQMISKLGLIKTADCYYGYLLNIKGK